MSNSKFNKIDKEQFMFDLDKMTSNKLAYKYNVNIRTIERWKSKFGLTEPHLFYTIDKDKFKKEYSKMSIIQLARKYNVARSTIRRWKNNLGLNEKINNRITQEDAILFCKKYELEILNLKNLKSLNSQLICKTKEGYKVKIRIRNLKDGHQPQIIDTSNPYSIDNIKLYCKINRNDYLFMNDEYQGSKIRYRWKYIGNQNVSNPYFLMSWNTFFMGCGHPDIHLPRGERKILDLLVKNKLKFKMQYTFNDLKGYRNSSLRFDFAILNENNTVKYLIEYDSILHEESIEYFNGDEGLKYRQYHDRLKNVYCINNNIPLIRLPEKKIKLNITLNDVQLNTTKFLIN